MSNTVSPGGADPRYSQPCVLPCDQVLKVGTAFPCLLGTLDAHPQPKGTPQPCPMPDPDQPHAIVEALSASDLMREDLALYLCLHPDTPALRALYHLLGQKLHCLMETADAQNQQPACLLDIPVYPPVDVQPDADMGARIQQFCNQVYGPMHLAGLQSAAYARLNHPIASIFGRMAMHNIRLGKMLGNYAHQLGAANAHGAYASIPLIPMDVLLQSIIDGCAAAAAKAQALAQRSQDTALMQLLAFTQVRMQVQAARASQAQLLLATSMPPV